MAKKAWIQKELRKKRVVEKFAKLRAELKANGDSQPLTTADPKPADITPEV